MVVALPVARLTVSINAGLVVVGDQGDVARAHIVETVGAAYRHEGVAEGGRIANRFLGDDVDGSANGRGAEERRTAASADLHAVDHVGRNLLQPIDAVERREDRTGIDQNLRIVAIKSVDSHLGETAVLAIVFRAHARLEIESLSQTNALGDIEELRPNHVHQIWCQASCCFVAVGGNHHLVERHVVGLQGEILFLRGIVLHGHGFLHCLIPQEFHHNGVCAFGQIFQEIMPRLVGCRGDGGAFKLYCDKRHVLSGLLVNHMPVDIGIRAFVGVFPQRIFNALGLCGVVNYIIYLGCLSPK